MPFDASTSKETLYNEKIRFFVEAYRKNPTPIEVNFRALASELGGPDRVTHLIHTYPAKLLMQIPHFFLSNSVLSKAGDTVLDPFCGSGTVILESLLKNRVGLGADANPLARLVTQVKTTFISPALLSRELGRVIRASKKSRLRQLPEVVNREYWFPEKTCFALTRILHSIKRIRRTDVRDFMLVAFSNCVKKVSFADPTVSVPVKLNPNRFGKTSERRRSLLKRIAHLKSVDVYGRFEAIASANIERMKALEDYRKLNKTGSGLVIAIDAKSLTRHIGTSEKLAPESVQLIVTSPPYAGAQKYIRSCSLSLGWLEMVKPIDLPSLDRKIIGREQFRASELATAKIGIKKADSLIAQLKRVNPRRAVLVYSYLSEMKLALSEMTRVLKPGGYVVLVVGNNRICGKELNTQEYLSEFLTRCGLDVQFKLIDDIRSYGLMTKRNKTADIISREWVLVFRKPIESSFDL